MNILRRLITVFTRSDEIDSFIYEEYTRKLKEEKESDNYRLKLCKKHRQESRYAEYSTDNCCHCKLEAHTEELEDDLNRVDLHDAQLAEYDKQLEEENTDEK